MVYVDPNLTEFFRLHGQSPVIPRLRSNFNLSGTDTGRWSATESCLGSGASLHTWPRSMCPHVPKCKGDCAEPTVLRRMIRADPGRVFVLFDQRQAEALIVGILAEDDRMVEWALEGTIHKRVAGIIYGRDWKEVAKKTDEYETSKHTVHANNYGLGIKKYATLIEKPVAMARTLQNIYLTKVFPNVREVFHKWIEAEITTHRRLVGMFGRERVFLGRLDADTFRKGYAQVPQAGISDLTKLCIPKVWMDPIRHVVLEHHDALLLSVRDDISDVAEAIEVVEKAFASTTFTLKGKEWRVPVDCEGVGYSWGSLMSFEEWRRARPKA